MVRRRHGCAAALVLVLCGCHGRDDLDGSRRRLPGVGERAAEPAPREPSEGEGEQPAVAVSMLDNRAMATHARGGATTVWTSGARLVPFVDGNLRGEWLLSAVQDAAPVALVRGRVANLFVPLDADPGGVLVTERASLPVTVRLRPAVASQVVSVFVNEHRIGELFVKGDALATATIDVAREHWIVGENRIRFFFRHLGTMAGHDNVAAAVEWVTVGAVAPVAPPSFSRRASGAGPSVTTAGGSRLSFYARVPPQPDASWTAAVQGRGSARVEVVTADGASRRLWTGEAPAELSLSLSALRGQIVRFDLHSDDALQWIDPVIRASAPRAPTSEVAAVDHIVVWSVSSLRSDRIDDQGEGFGRFRRRSVDFADAFSPGPSPILAHSAVLAGRASLEGPDAQTPTVAERLRSIGYSTLMVSGNGFIHDGNGFARGFDQYRNPMRQSHPHGADVLWQWARRHLSRRKDGKTFTYLATVEPHVPYTPNESSLAAVWGARHRPLAPARTAVLSQASDEELATLPAEHREFVRALYDAEVRDADAAFASMLRDLGEMELLDRTAIVLFGDHGEELFESGRFGHGAGLGEEVLRVPLMIVVPGRPPERRTEPVVLADLYPTLLALAGDSDPPASRGRNLLGATRPAERPVVSRTADGAWSLRLGDHKVVADPRRGIEIAGAGGRSPVLEHFLRAALGFAVAYDDVWTEARWGSVTNHALAFPADQGL